MISLRSNAGCGTVGFKTLNLQHTPAEAKPDLPLEIAHLLLIDIVGYSKPLVNEQIEVLQELKRIVRGTGLFSRCRSKRQTHSSANR